MALPIPSTGSAQRISPPVSPGSTPRAALAPIQRAPTPTGAPATIASQAIAEAQASLAQAWNGSPQIGTSLCGRPTSACPNQPSPGALRLGLSLPAATAAKFPPAVSGAALAYDASPFDQFVVLFGGILQNGAPSGQTWIYALGGWSNITPTHAKPQPSPRWGAMMDFDATDGYVVLFGGCSLPPIDGLCIRSLGDTWRFLMGT